LTSHADDVCADRVRADLIERATSDAENVECFGRLGAVARVGGYQRTRRVEFTRQPFDPLVFAHLRVIAEPERTRDFGERRRVTLAVLPQVESRQMQAEDRDLPHQTVDGAGRVNGLVRAQTVSHEPQIFPARRAVAVDVGDVRAGACECGYDWQSGPDRNQRVFFGRSQGRSQIAVAAKRVFDPCVNVREFLAVRLLGVTRGDYCGDGGQRYGVLFQ